MAQGRAREDAASVPAPSRGSRHPRHAQADALHSGSSGACRSGAARTRVKHRVLPSVPNCPLPPESQGRGVSNRIQNFWGEAPLPALKTALGKKSSGKSEPHPALDLGSGTARAVGPGSG